jgi:hypothetical protein
LAGFGGGGGGASALAVGAGLGAGGAGFGGGGDGAGLVGAGFGGGGDGAGLVGAGFGGGGDGAGLVGAGFGGGGDDDLAGVEAGAVVLVPLEADDPLLDAVADGADPLIPGLPGDRVWPDAPPLPPTFDQAGGPPLPVDRGGAAAEELVPGAGFDRLSPGGAPPLRSSPGGTPSACAASMTVRVAP